MRKDGSGGLEKKCTPAAERGEAHFGAVIKRREKTWDIEERKGAANASEDASLIHAQFRSSGKENQTFGGGQLLAAERPSAPDYQRT